VDLEIKTLSLRYLSAFSHLAWPFINSTSSTTYPRLPCPDIPLWINSVNVYTPDDLHWGHPRHPQSAHHLCTVTVTVQLFTSELKVLVGAAIGGVVTVDPAAQMIAVQLFVGHAGLSGCTQICGHAMPCHLVVVVKEAQAMVVDGLGVASSLANARENVDWAVIVACATCPAARTMSAAMTRMLETIVVCAC
jgi:hypothetical protein